MELNGVMLCTALVIMAGVGTPDGVSGTSPKEKTFAFVINSASRVGVSDIMPGIPACVMPSISHVRVTDAASKKSALPCGSESCLFVKILYVLIFYPFCDD